MSVTVDHQPLEVEGLGLRTIGQVLTHLRRANRLVVQIKVDGREPGSALRTVKRFPVSNHTVFIETADPKQMASGVLDEVESQLRSADRMRGESLEMLKRNQPAGATEKLAGCFSTWQHAQETVVKTAQLLRIDLSCVRVQGRSFPELMGDFTRQLTAIREALEGRDFAELMELLGARTNRVIEQWYLAIASLRAAIG